MASMLLIAACAFVELAPRVRAMASSERGSEAVVAVAIGLAGVALEGWRRARAHRADAAALRGAQCSSRATERWTRTVLDHVADAVLLASPEGRFVEVNEPAAALLGGERHRLVGRRMWDLLPQDDRLPALRRGDLMSPRGGGLRRLLRADGSVVLAEVTWSTLDDGRVVYLARRFRGG